MKTRPLISKIQIVFNLQQCSDTKFHITYHYDMSIAVILDANVYDGLTTLLNNKSVQ